MNVYNQELLIKTKITVSEYDDLINKADKYDKHYD